MIKVLPLASGSTGNCIYFEIDDKRFIVDLGVSGKLLNYAFCENSIDPGLVEAVFITHTHSDHTKGIEPCMNILSCPIYLSATSKKTLCIDNAVALDYERRSILDNGLSVFPFRTVHDCPGSVGFVFEYNGQRIGYATDLGIITDKILGYLSGSDLIIIESNHDVQMLSDGPYPGFLKKRILSDDGHLSNDSCAEAISYLYEKGTKHFMLAHLSRENNTCSKALEQSKKAVPYENITLQALLPQSFEVFTFNE